MEDLFNKVTEVKKQYTEAATEALKEMFKVFFEKHPEVTKVVWTQYTPYWNDGEATEFSVNSFDTFDDDNEDDDDEVSDCSKAAQKTLTKMECFARDNEDVMRQVFGDHVKVKATKKGFEVNDYDHE